MHTFRKEFLVIYRGIKIDYYCKYYFRNANINLLCNKINH